jgi:hypothetical protein
MTEQEKQDLNFKDKMGGRKVTAFYATLASCLLLALLDKAHSEVLGLIDTLFFIYAGANVMTKRSPPQNNQQSSEVQNDGK